MSVRVVARIRPLLAQESEKDIIVQTESPEPGKPTTVVKIPNPRNEDEEFSFTFNGVYDQSASQEDLFASEVGPQIKSLFQGTDITIFAYGVTGTGKTHTMQGGMKLADRGVIPRLLSAIFRRGRRLAKETEGDTVVHVALSYYEIYNDKVYDLLEPQEQRRPAGLPLRTDANGKTEVVGLMERACSDLKDFEKLYIEANNNRVTAATKLNTYSSRSHAILRVKLTQTTGDEVRESIASAIDLAGSEDNRRTDSGKERLVESAAINKSLFVLSQCVDAISRGDKRIPYRESKMTRILSLGQDNGITIMILNLSPLRCCHLDTLSSLNISSRAKRIEAREIENEVVFKQVPRAHSDSTGTGGFLRQPLRPLANAINALNVHSGNAVAKAAEMAKPVKAFSVFSDKVVRPVASTPQAPIRPPKRPLDTEASSRPTKLARPARTYRASLQTPQTQARKEQRDSAASVLVSTANIEAMVEKKVSEILAALDAAEKPAQSPLQNDIPNAIQRRLEALERRVENEECRDDGKSEGLRHLFKARQAKEKGDDTTALRAYELALPYFPDQVRLRRKIEKLRKRLGLSDGGSVKGEDPVEQNEEAVISVSSTLNKEIIRGRRRKTTAAVADGEAKAEKEERPRLRSKSRNRRNKRTTTTTSTLINAKKSTLAVASQDKPKSASPRTQQLLEVINSGDRARIRGLVGFGPKKAHDLVSYLALAHADGGAGIESLAQLRALPGLGGRAVDRAYEGLCGASS